MIELRYLVGAHFLRLQYKVLVPTWQASGAWGEPSGWSGWQDVEVVQAKDTGSYYCEACGATVLGTEEEHLERVHGKPAATAVARALLLSLGELVGQLTSNVKTSSDEWDAALERRIDSAQAAIAQADAAGIKAES
jgi:hypothetical protein